MSSLSHFPDNLDMCVPYQTCDALCHTQPRHVMPFATHNPDMSGGFEINRHLPPPLLNALNALNALNSIDTFPLLC
jgi:hypothetical protein